MKIIGTTNGGYLMQATANEVAQICGFDSAFDTRFKAHLAGLGVLSRSDGSLPSIAVGSEVTVSAAWNRLQRIRAKEVELHKASETMRGLADLIDGAWPAIVAELPVDLSEGSK